MNVAFQPLAGIMGVVTHPARGVGKQIRRSITKEPAELILAGPRIEMGKRATQAVDGAGKKDIIDRFEILSQTVKERKKAALVEAKRWARDVDLRAVEMKRERKAIKKGTRGLV